MATYQELTKIAEQYGSPFYIFDKEIFIRNFQNIRTAFKQRYPQVSVGYSYKTNYIPYICRLVKELGGYAEVVSRLELDIALRVGCLPTEIIYNGPVKTVDDIAFALDADIIVNIDTMRELEFVIDFAGRNPEKICRIGLRINITLVDDQGKSHLQNELSFSRFGFTDGAIKTAVMQLKKSPNVRVCSLHGHTSSSDRSLWCYQSIANKLASVGEQYFPDSIELINIGGGFFGRSALAMGLTNTPTFDDYAETISDVLHHHPWIKIRQPWLVIEPGLAVVADTLSFITKVFEVKNIGGEQLAVVDGSIFNVKPTLHQRNHPFSIIKKTITAGPKRRYNIVGSTCMEKDYLLQDIECAEIEREDFIRIENVGAYTIVMTPPFINPAPPILVRDPKGYIVIRQRQDFNNIFGNYLF